MSENNNKNPVDKEAKPIIGVEPETSSGVNRPLVFFIVAIVAIILVFVIADAFKAPPKSTHSSYAPKNQGFGVNKGVVNRELSKLPSSYSQSGEINRILHRGDKEKIVQTLPDSVKKELSQLQQEQSDLSKQLSDLKAKKKAQDDSKYSKDDLDAMRSTQVFPSDGRPPFAPYKTHKKDAATQAAAAGHSSSYASQNMQDQKDKFFSQESKMDVYNKDRLQYPVSKYILQAGTVFPAVLQTTLDSDNPGVVMGRVRSDVYDSITGQHLLLPKGTKLLGIYSSKISPGQSSLQIIFNRLIRPDGSSLTMKDPAVNDVGSTGITDTVNNHWGRIIGAAALMTVFNIPAMISQNQILAHSNDNDNGGGNLYAASALGSASSSTQEVGSKFVDQAMQIQPTITVHAGKQFAAFVTRDIVIPPFKG